MLTQVVSNLALNTVSPVKVEQYATRVVVSNRSYFDVAVSFQPIMTGASGYGVLTSGSVVVHPRHVAKIVIPPGQRHNVGYFDGTVYLYPLMATGSYASNGTVSAPTTVFVTSLMAADEDLDIAADAMSYDAQSQQRVIALPFGPLSVTGTHSFIAAETFQVPGLIFGPPGSQATWNGLQVAHLYLYGLEVTLLTAAAGLQFFSLIVQQLNNVSAVLATNNIHQWGYLGAGETSPYTPSFVVPIRESIQPQNTCAFLQIAIANTSGAGLNLAYNIRLDIDSTNTGQGQFPRAIGGGSAGNIGSTGFIF